MEETRNQIFDFLFRVTSPQTIEEIAAQTALDIETVRQAIDHPWFDLVEDRVTIAYSHQE